jgi:phosphoribosyl-ATP pyrophosphohydrolase/phosphoribosyl-AMP cyclohydrolase/histidinol dehydrogenase
MSLLQVKSASEASVREIKSDPFDEETFLSTRAVVADVKKRGVEAVVELAVKYKEIETASEASLLLTRDQLKEAYDTLDEKSRGVLDRVAARIRQFALDQKGALSPLSVSVCGGKTGHSLVPIASAGCYAPGGRYPLPSSVLMTAITAQVAGVSRIIVASPKPTQIVRAAAFVSGASALLAAGGAHAIAALAYGIRGIEPVDVIVGPGNRYVTAAKSIVSSFVKIDALAGPSECLVVADDSADASIIASDLLAQAEHDDDARAILVTTSQNLLAKVEAELQIQLATLPSAPTARNALKNSFAVVVSSIQQAIPVVDAIAPEHLELHFENATKYRDSFSNAGAVFVGHHSAEVLGDYGFGPNHVLPTLGSARYSSGLSVFTFLRTRTWIELTQLKEAQEAVQDAVDMARLEGLEAHARSAEKRLLAAVVEPSKATSSTSSIATVHTNANGVATYHLTHAIPVEPEKVLFFAVPKGNMESEIHQLLADAGFKLTITSRGYRPAISHPGIDVKLLKPRNVVQMVELGSRDIGFTGHDLIHELGIKGVECVLDTGLSPVRIVIAAPSEFIVDGELKKINRPYRIATEYEALTTAWMRERGIDFTIVKSRGATEVFPPEDADLIVDNTATGSTLRANNLHIVDTILTSTTGLYANSQSLKDPKKKAIIDQMVTMMQAVLLARSHMLVEFHVPGANLQNLLAVLPAMKQPTITQLHNDAGHTVFSIKTAVQKNLGELVRLIKENGGSDIIVTKPTYVII